MTGTFRHNAKFLQETIFVRKELFVSIDPGLMWTKDIWFVTFLVVTTFLLSSLCHLALCTCYWSR